MTDLAARLEDHAILRCLLCNQRHHWSVRAIPSCCWQRTCSAHSERGPNTASRLREWSLVSISRRGSWRRSLRLGQPADEDEAHDVLQNTDIWCSRLTVGAGSGVGEDILPIAASYPTWLGPASLRVCRSLNDGMSRRRECHTPRVVTARAAMRGMSEPDARPRCGLDHETAFLRRTRRRTTLRIQARSACIETPLEASECLPGRPSTYANGACAWCRPGSAIAIWPIAIPRVSSRVPTAS
jgi:hypothetical protein